MSGEFLKPLNAIDKAVSVSPSNEPPKAFLNLASIAAYSSEVIDYRNSKPSPNFPHFRCSNEECDQGNGYPWSSWNEDEFD